MVTGRVNHFRIFSETDGVHPGESKTRFLARHGVGFGPADPDRMPYYLLLVADPEEISYRFQYELDVTYAVGRIHFDSLEEYARYARSIVAAETHPAPRPARAAFVGVRNDDDRATRLSADHLIEPLSGQLVGEQTDWIFDVRLADQATKATVRPTCSGGVETPALLFTASHGMGFPERASSPTSRPGSTSVSGLAGPSAMAAAGSARFLLRCCRC